MDKEQIFQEIVDQVALCNQCNECLSACPTFQVAEKEMYGPPFRLSVAGKVFNGIEPSDDEREAVYSCPQCGACEVVCPQEIRVSEIMNACRRRLVVDGFGPLEKHNKVIDGLQKKGNSVNGDPAKRWEWLPEAFPRNESDTLFYAGCLPAYLVKNSARSSYLVLKELGIDFMLEETEDCCGIYYFNSGRWDLAKEKFEENQERFQKLGVKKIITTCAGCFHCFKYYYPRLVEDWDLEVRHIIEIVMPLLTERKQELTSLQQEVTFFDSCRLGRKEGLYDLPREILDLCGVATCELPENKENAPCCGAGAGIRSVYPKLSMDMALRTLDAASANTVVTSCPFCSFNLSYAAKKGGSDKKIAFITDLVLESLVRNRE